MVMYLLLPSQSAHKAAILILVSCLYDYMLSKHSHGGDIFVLYCSTFDVLVVLYNNNYSNSNSNCIICKGYSPLLQIQIT